MINFIQHFPIWLIQKDENIQKIWKTSIHKLFDYTPSVNRLQLIIHNCNPVLSRTTEKILKIKDSFSDIFQILESWGSNIKLGNI